MWYFGAHVNPGKLRKTQEISGKLRQKLRKTQENSGNLRKTQENSGKPIQRTNAICKPSKTECETVDVFITSYHDGYEAHLI